MFFVRWTAPLRQRALGQAAGCDHVTHLPLTDCGISNGSTEQRTISRFSLGILVLGVASTYFISCLLRFRQLLSYSSIFMEVSDRLRCSRRFLFGSPNRASLRITCNPWNLGGSLPTFLPSRSVVCRSPSILLSPTIGLTLSLLHSNQRTDYLLLTSLVLQFSSVTN